MELDKGSKYEEPKGDHNQIDMPQINTEQSQDQQIGNFLMDKLHDSGHIVPNNVIAPPVHPTKPPKNENKIANRYDELMLATRVKTDNIHKKNSVK